MAYGDEKVVVDVKDVDRGAILYTDAGGKEHTYHPARSIWLEVQTLQILTVLGGPAEEGGTPKLITRVRGSAVLEDYSISVVGDPSSKVRALRISFEAGEYGPKRSPEENPLLFGSSLEILGGAMVGFSRADWEIGNSDEWWISCYLPEFFIDALLTDIRSGWIDSMNVGLRLSQLYTTEHPWAPVSSRGHLFLRPNKLDNSIGFPEMASGVVWVMNFASTSRDLSKPAPPEPVEPDGFDEETQAPAPDNPVASAVAILALRVESLRGTLKWVGGAIVVALLFLASK